MNNVQVHVREGHAEPALPQALSRSRLSHTMRLRSIHSVL
jgi:hypothetical protein